MLGESAVKDKIRKKFEKNVGQRSKLKIEKDGKNNKKTCP